MKGRKRKILIFVIFVGVLIYLAFVAKIFNKNNLMEVISLQESSSSNFFAIFTLLSTILLVFFVPLSWISFFSVYFFGMKGFFTMIISATLAAIVSFSIARLFSRNIMSIVTAFYNKKERRYDLDYISSLIEKHGIGYIIYMRNTPVIPFTLASYIAGSSRISFYEHLIGTVIGLIPSLLISVYFYSSIMNITKSISGVIIAGILKVIQVITVFYLFKRKFK